MARKQSRAAPGAYGTGSGARLQPQASSRTSSSYCSLRALAAAARRFATLSWPVPQHESRAFEGTHLRVASLWKERSFQDLIKGFEQLRIFFKFLNYRHC